MGKQKPAYDFTILRSLQGIPLPQKLKCERCHKFLNQASFSQKQLSDARMAIKNKGMNATYKIKCVKCVGGHLVEIECVGCHQTKGIDEFAKTQRRKPDSARCFECVEEQLATTPVEEEAYEDPRKAYVPVESSAGIYPEYWSAQSTAHSAHSVTDPDDEASFDHDEGGVSLLEPGMRKVSMSDSHTSTLIDGDYGYNNNTAGSIRSANDGWQTAQAKSWHTETTATKSTSLSVTSSFDPNKYGKPTSRIGTVSGTSRTFSSNVTEHSDRPTENTQYKNGWAKIKAFVPQKPTIVAEDDWKSESEEEDDDDDDDDAEI